MNARETLLQTQNRLLASHAHARDLLRRYPGVVDVGVGVKERGGGYTDELAYRVYVREKAHALDLGADGVLPREVLGMGVDVVVAVDSRKASGDCATSLTEWEASTPTRKNDEKLFLGKYRALQPGIRINRGLSRSTMGTLGAIVKIDALGTYGFLTAGHVLAKKNGSSGSLVGQPNLSPCGCNKIGHVYQIDTTLDCGVACIDDYMGVSNCVAEKPDVRISGKRAEVSPGTGISVICGETVLKAGASSGMTFGKVVDVAFGTHGDLLIAPTQGVLNDESVICFGMGGDSGSAILYAEAIPGGYNYYVVGMMHSVDDSDSRKAVAHHIIPVATALGITMEVEDWVLGYQVSGDGGPQPPATPQRMMDWELASLPFLKGGEWSGWRTIWDTHSEEIIHLVNHDRQVKVAWNKGKGPALVAATSRAQRQQDTAGPQLANNVSPHALMLRMAVALLDRGGPMLRGDIERELQKNMQFSGLSQY